MCRRKSKPTYHVVVGKTMNEIQTLKLVYNWDGNILDKISLKHSTGEIEEYPIYCSILDNIDTDKLLEEFNQIRGELDKETGTYLKKWFKPRGIDWEEAKVELAMIGFDAKKYRQYNAMDLEEDADNVSQWTKLKPWVGEYTQSVFKRFKSPVIRARYSIVQPGWILKAHIDYPKPKTHGFRIHIPIQTSPHSEHCFFINDEWKITHFSAGKAWFMNVSVPHKAYHLTDSERIYLTLDLWTDEDIPLVNQTDRINYLETKYNS